MSNIEEYFINNNIPYKKNVRIYNMKIFRACCNFIIPGAIVSVKLGENYHLSRLIIHLNHLRDLLNDSKQNMKIYLYIKEKMKNKIMHLQEDYSNLCVITNLEEIKYNDIPIYCNNISQIRTLVSPNFPNKDKIKKIIFGDKYNHAIVILTDKEMNDLNSYNFSIDPKFDTTQQHIIFKNNKVKKYDLHNASISEIFNIFQMKFTNYSLELIDGKRGLPLRIIENITKKCKICDNIIYVNQLCVKCKVHEIRLT